MPLRHWILVLDASGLLADRGPLSAIAVCRIDEVDADASILGKA